MFNPFEMLLAQGAGAQAAQGLGQPFGLSPEQTRRAVEALLPAFALGLQRNPGGDPAALMRLFSSPVMNQAVLQQAAAASGVGTQALRQMLPAMAGMVVASLVHVMLNPPPAAAPARPEPEPPDAFAAGSAAWAEMMKAFLPPPSPPAAAPAPPPRPVESPAPRPVETAPSPGLDVFQQMLRTGTEVQEENVRAMKGIFDAFWMDGTAAPASAPKPDPGRRSRPPKEASVKETLAKDGSPARPRKGIAPKG